MSQINAQAAFELKASILSMAASVTRSFTQEGAALVNKAARELFKLTGEVFANGSFVKLSSTRKDEQGRFITTDTKGVQFVSDAQGNVLKDEEGFVTFVNVAL